MPLAGNRRVMCWLCAGAVLVAGCSTTIAGQPVAHISAAPIPSQGPLAPTLPAPPSAPGIPNDRVVEGTAYEIWDKVADAMTGLSSASGKITLNVHQDRESFPVAEGRFAVAKSSSDGILDISVTGWVDVMLFESTSLEYEGNDTVDIGVIWAGGFLYLKGPLAELVLEEQLPTGLYWLKMDPDSKNPKVRLIGAALEYAKQGGGKPSGEQLKPQHHDESIPFYDTTETGPKTVGEHSCVEYQSNVDSRFLQDISEGLQNEVMHLDICVDSKNLLRRVVLSEGPRMSPTMELIVDDLEYNKTAKVELPESDRVYNGG